MKILAIIPAYNEEKNILALIEEFEKKCPHYDYVVINDCSSDLTRDVLINNRINHISHPINLGLSETIKTGFRYAIRMGYDAAVQIDGDGQHNPASIDNLVKAMEKEKLDFVQGSRFADNDRKNVSIRMVGSRMISAAIWLSTFKRVKDPTNGMRLFSRRLMYRFITENSLYVEPDTIAYFIKDKYCWKEVYVEVRPRKFGHSYLTTFRAMMYMVQVMFSILFVQAFRPKKHRTGKEKIMEAQNV